MTISETARKARKDYICGTCGVRIPKGSHYARLYGYGREGDPPYQLRLCLGCGKVEKAAEPPAKGEARP